MKAKRVSCDLRAREGRLSFALACALFVLAAPLATHAQRHFDVEAFEPAPNQAGSVLSVYGARTLPKAGYSLGLMASYGRRPLSIESSNGHDLGDLIGSVSTLSVLGSVGIWRRLDLGVAIPIHRVSRGSRFETPPPAAVEAARVDDTRVAFGDIRLVPRVALLERKPDAGVGLALLAPLSLPTGKDNAYVGESFRVEPRVALDWAKRRNLLAVNVGYLFRERTRLLGSVVDDMLRWGVGANITLWNELSLLIEGSGSLNVLNKNFVSNDAPSEALLGLRYFGASGFLAQLGGGPGLVRGLGAPQYRLFAALGFNAEPKQADPDRDRDGILDTRDRCPREPEDVDGYQDDDGCPDPDNDRDGVLDAQDGCPENAEDLDKVEDADGCPDLDDDHDNVLDSADKCPVDAEDADGFEDSDGCSDPDNDKDGVLDAADRCVNEAGVSEHNGCPAPPPPGKVEVTTTGIALHETVYFGRNSSIMQPRSQPLMDELARVLKEHAEIEHVVVEGHTDDSGPIELNTRLSNERAQSVVSALTSRGISAGRLRAEGFGPTKPLVPNDSPEHRTQNRRVELRIER